MKVNMLNFIAVQSILSAETVSEELIKVNHKQTPGRNSIFCNGLWTKYLELKSTVTSLCVGSNRRVTTNVKRRIDGTKQTI